MFRRTDADDRGAILPLVVISMVLLLGMGAMVIDIGHLYAERRQLQNGADAAALAIAQSCALKDTICRPGAYEGMATDLANRAARDNMTTVREICFGGRTTGGLPQCSGGAAGDPRALGWVRVTTRTLTPEGDEVDFLLAPIVTALTGYTVEATAIAGWGIAGSGRVLPFAVHECEYNALGGVLDPLNGVYPSGEQIIYSRYTTGNHSDQDCRTDYLGDGTSPGNYGWLDKPRLECFADASVDVWSPGDPGNNPEIRDCADEILNQTVLVAIWQDADLSGGANAEYEIIAFVGFTVTGYDLSGFHSPGFTCPPNPADPGAPAGSLRCFRGVFTEATFDGDFGGYYNTGVTTVKMIG